MQHFTLFTPEPTQGLWILHRRESNPTRCNLFAKYARFRCPACGAVDCKTILKEGLTEPIHTTPPAVDLVVSQDGLLLVSEKSRVALQSIANGTLLYTEIPGCSTHWVVLPKVIYSLPRDGKLYTPVEPPVHGEPFQIRRRPCKKCARLSGGFQPQWFIVPDPIAIAAVDVGFDYLWGLWWICSDDVVKTVQAQRLTGWRFDSHAFPTTEVERQQQPGWK